MRLTARAAAVLLGVCSGKIVILAKKGLIQADRHGKVDPEEVKSVLRLASKSGGCCK